jgi:hypothetical protein
MQSIREYSDKTVFVIYSPSISFGSGLNSLFVLKSWPSSHDQFINKLLWLTCLWNRRDRFLTRVERAKSCAAALNKKGVARQGA